MTAAERFARMESSRAARSASDVTTERRPMPKYMEGKRTGGMRLPSQGRIVDYVGSFSVDGKPWQVVKVCEYQTVVTNPGAPGDGVTTENRRIVLSAHGTQADAETRAGEGRDALTDAEVGEGWNVVAERRPRGKR